MKWEFREEREAEVENHQNMVWKLERMESCQVSADGNSPSGRWRLDCRIFVEERTAVAGRGTGESKAELTLPTAPQITRLKHKESELCHGPGAKCFVKGSLPVLSRVTQGKALFISA